VQHMAGLIQRSAEWMQHIVQDLLDRASLDAGRLTLHRTPTAVGDMLDVIVELYTPIALERSIDFVLDSASDLPALNADPDRLLQALSNLVSNAMKFTPPGGRVELQARPGDPFPDSTAVDEQRPVQFSVRDTGPGIAPEDLTHIFEWFWRSPAGASGAGLGLAIAKGLIEAHHGQLHVDSKLGEGSTFWFVIPTVLTRIDRHEVEMMLS
jgi:signal transduction histidine kinase